ncbi:MAG: response regulator [Candidatus Methylomirabilales bacterium]
MAEARRILMVDDDALILEAVGDMLTAREYQVTRARDGLEALERFRESPFDLAILDVVLPKIDGHELCRLIRQDARGRLLPIIAFTALGPQDVAKLPGLSADAYVAKGPLTVVFPNILDAIKSVMSSRRGRQSPQRIFGFEGFRSRQIVSELFALNQYRQRLIHSLAQVVIELDEQAKIVSANLMALRLLGRSEAEVTGIAFTDLLKPEERAAFETFLRRLSEDPLETPVTEVTFAGTDHRLVCRPVLDNGEVLGILVMARS